MKNTFPHCQPYDYYLSISNILLGQRINYNYYFIYSWAAPSTSVSLSASFRDIIFHIILKFEQVLISHRNIIVEYNRKSPEKYLLNYLQYPHKNCGCGYQNNARISVDAELRHTSTKYYKLFVDTYIIVRHSSHAVGEQYTFFHFRMNNFHKNVTKRCKEWQLNELNDNLI